MATTTETRGSGRPRRPRRHPAANARLVATGVTTSATFAIMGGIALAQGGSQASPGEAPGQATPTAASETTTVVSPEAAAVDRSPQVIVVRRIQVVPGETDRGTPRAIVPTARLQSTAAPAPAPTPTRTVAPPERRAPATSHATSSGSPG